MIVLIYKEFGFILYVAFPFLTVRALEKAKTTGQFAVSSAVNAQAGAFEESESESSIDGEISHGRRKKLKTSD